MFMTATSYGLGRYAYGLFIPTFRDAFSLTDTRLALIASFSYGGTVMCGRLLLCKG